MTVIKVITEVLVKIKIFTDQMISIMRHKIRVIDCNLLENRLNKDK